MARAATVRPGSVRIVTCCPASRASAAPRIRARRPASLTESRTSRAGEQPSASSCAVCGTGIAGGVTGGGAGGVTGGSAGGLTVSDALAVLPAPPFADWTTPVVLVCAPAADAVTLTEKVQLEATGIVPPASVTRSAPVVIVPAPQLPVRPFGDAIASPAGSTFSSATPVRSMVLPAGLAISMVSGVDSPTVMAAAPNEAETSGGATTASAPAGSLHPVVAAAWWLSPP